MREYQYKLADHRYGLDTLSPHQLEFNDEEHSIVIPFAASQGQDRIGDFLEISGIQTENHERNPIAYLNHAVQVEKPIGKCEDPQGNYTVTIDLERGLAIAKIFLAVDVPNFPEPLQCYELYKGGYLKAGSIGYRPLEANIIPPNPKAGHFKKALHIITCELLEVSLVGLPCNQDTVQKLFDEGVAGQPLSPFIKSMFGPIRKKTWANGCAIMRPKLLDRSTMNKDAMSAIDQSTGGAFVGEGEEKMEGPEMPHGAQVLKAIHESLCAAKSIHEDNAGVLDNADVKKLLEKCMPKMESLCGKIAEGYKSMYPDLDPLPGGENDETDEESDDDDETAEPESESEADEKTFSKRQLDLIAETMAHLEECSEKATSKTQKAAHKHYISQLAKLTDQGEDEISPEDETKILGFLNHIEKNLQQTERKIYAATGN